MVLLHADFWFTQIVKIPWSQCVVFQKDVITIQLLLFGVFSSVDLDCKAYILLVSPLGCIVSRRKIMASSSLNHLLQSVSLSIAVTM